MKNVMIYNKLLTKNTVFNFRVLDCTRWYSAGRVTLHTPITTAQYTSGTLSNLLEVANLLEAYNSYLHMFSMAEKCFNEGNNRHACDILHQIWMAPKIIPALLLVECFYMQELILPAWRSPWGMILLNKPKSSGGSRQIIVPNKQTRISMGVINSLLQTSCKSWSDRTTGFRPDHGTIDAIKKVQINVRDILIQNNQAHIICFDIKAAFNSVCMPQLFKTLELNYLPHKVKYIIWEWHNSRVIYSATTPSNNTVSGLPQGFSYCPTLFAWYLDTILKQQTDWIIYADNLVGVFKSRSEALNNLQLVSNTLASYGLKINSDTIFGLSLFDKGSHVLFNSGTHAQAKAWLDSQNFAWLGHYLNIPSYDIYTPKHVQKRSQVVAQTITIDDWKNMLHESLWLEQVLLSNWRK